MIDLKNFIIAHTADVHTNIDGINVSRKIEWDSNLDNLSDAVIAIKPDMFVIEGDLINVFNPSELTRIAIANFLLRLDKVNIITIVTDGNHDLDQRTFAYDGGNGIKTTRPNAIESIIKTINSEYILYLDETRFWNGNEINSNLPSNIQFALWNHKSKYSVEEEPLNPWLDKKNFTEGIFTIDLFHDPIYDCKNFDNKIVKGDNESRVKIQEFQGDLALLGDIHLPQLFHIDGDENNLNNIAVYPSSPFPCHYGEGDYYTNCNKSYQNGNDKHGIRSYSINLDQKKVNSTQWHKSIVHTSYHTIDLDNNLTDEMVDNFVLDFEQSSFYKIRLRLNSVGEEFDVRVQNLTSRLKIRYNISELDIRFLKNTKIINTDESQTTVGVSDMGLDYVMGLVGVYSVDNINDPDPENTKLMRDDFINRMGIELNKLDWDVPVNVVEYREIRIYNFLSIGELIIKFHKNTIVQIIANNGIGKSNIGKALNWVGHNRIDSNQAGGRLNTFGIEYINDKSPEDTASVAIDVVVDGKLITIYRDVTRIWKRGKSFAKDPKNWKSNVSKVNVNFTITDETGGDITDKQEIYLGIIFGSFQEFNELHIINQNSLDSLVLMKPDKLMDFFLTHFNKNEFSQLTSRFSDISSDVMLGLHKPEISAVAMRSRIDEIALFIMDENEIIKGDTDNIKKIQILLDKENESKNSWNREMPSPDIRLIDRLSNQTLDTIQSEAENNHKAAESDVVVHRNALDLYNNKHTDLIGKQGVINKKIGDLNLMIDGNNTKIIEISKKDGIINSEINKLVFKSTETKNTELVNFHKNVSAKTTEYNSELTSINTIKNTIATELNAGIQSKITAKNSELVIFNSEINANTTKINGLLAENTKLQNDIDSHVDTCVACNRKYDNADQITEHKTKLTATITSNDSIIKLMKVDNASILSEKIEPINGELMDLKLLIIPPINVDSNPIISADQRVIDVLTKVGNIKIDLDKLNVEYSAMFNLGSETFMSDSETLLMEGYKASLVDVLSEGVVLADMGVKFGLDLTDLTSSVSTIGNELVALGDISALTKNIEIVSDNLLVMLERKNNALGEWNTYQSELVKVTKKNEILNTIHIIDNNITIHTNQINVYTQQINEVNIKITQLEDESKRLVDGIEKANKYRVAESLVKIIKHAIGPKGLRKLVFDKIADGLNYDLDNLMQGLNFRVFFDKDNNYSLTMLDLIGSSQSIRPNWLMSGMQLTIAGLALIDVVKRRKTTRNAPFILIDEITGKLNSGEKTEGTKTTNKNYQLYVANMLRKMADDGTGVYIIDHLLPPSIYDSSIKLSMNDDGVTYEIK